jgi:uncharacterized membrane protein
MPILYELVRKVKAKKEDVLLVLGNATVVFYYLWTILFDKYREPLALCALGLCAAHLLMMAVVMRRCRDDLNLRQVLLAIGLFFLTIAVPLYFRMNAITIAWAAEGVMLAIIGLRYRSTLTQIGGGVAMSLSCANLLWRLPMHTEAFAFVLNPAFGTWCFVAAIMLVCHLIYRRSCESAEDPYGTAAQILYALAMSLLFAATTMEWYYHCHYNIAERANYLWRGQEVIFAVTVLLFVIRPMRPAGTVCDAFTGIAVATGSVFTAIFVLTEFHQDGFAIFANPDFAAVLVFMAALLACHLVYRLMSESPDDRNGQIAQVLFGLTGLLLFATATMEWYCHCKYNLMAAGELHYISRGQIIIFAAILLLFAVRPVCPRGRLTDILSLVVLAAGSIFTVLALTRLHTGSFITFANPDFGIVVAFIVALLLCHIKWRLVSEVPEATAGLVSQIIYGVLGLLLLGAFAAEWYWHCVYNLEREGLSDALFRGQVIIFSTVMLLFVIRPVCPRGIVCKILATVLAAVGAIFAMITFNQVHTYSYVIFANANFGIVVLFVAALFVSACLLKHTSEEQPYGRGLAVALGLWGVFVLWVLLNEEIYLYWYCRNRYYRPLANWEFLAHMYISVMWAVYGAALFLAHMYISVMWAVYGAALMITGFWQRIRVLRYIALGLFTLLLAKVFIWDTRRIENVYRIGAFLATGVTLVGMSYIYQFLKKKGFFEAILAEKNPDG